MLNLSRNLGFVTGASAMGALFARAARTIDITAAQPEAVASGMRATFGVAALLTVLAGAILFAAAFVARQRAPGPSGDATVQPVAKEAGCLGQR